MNGESYLTDTNEHFRYITIKRVGKIIGMSNYAVDKICLACKALEKEVAVSRITVILYVYLGQIWLQSTKQLADANDPSHLSQTCTMPNSSRLSLASSFMISKSIFLAWFLDAVDCSLRLIDMIAAV